MESIACSAMPTPVVFLTMLAKLQPEHTYTLKYMRITVIARSFLWL